MRWLGCTVRFSRSRSAPTTVVYAACSWRSVRSPRSSAAFSLLEPRALSGASLYVAGHGLVKGALFLCVGVLLHRLESVDELALHGRGRSLGGVGILFALGGIWLSGVPPAGLFLGE